MTEKRKPRKISRRREMMFDHEAWFQPSWQKEFASLGVSVSWEEDPKRPNLCESVSTVRGKFYVKKLTKSRVDPVETFTHSLMMSF
jgi:hypothetical protein